MDAKYYFTRGGGGLNYSQITIVAFKMFFTRHMEMQGIEGYGSHEGR